MTLRDVVTATTPPRTLEATEVEAFVETLVAQRLREFRTQALLFGGDHMDLDTLDAIEADIRAQCEAEMDKMRTLIARETSPRDCTSG